MDEEAWHKFLKAWCLMNESYFSEVAERLERAVRAPDYLHSTKARPGVTPYILGFSGRPAGLWARVLL